MVSLNVEIPLELNRCAVCHVYDQKVLLLHLVKTVSRFRLLVQSGPFLMGDQGVSGATKDVKNHVGDLDFHDKLAC